MTGIGQRGSVVPASSGNRIRAWSALALLAIALGMFPAIQSAPGQAMAASAPAASAGHDHSTHAHDGVADDTLTCEDRGLQTVWGGFCTHGNDPMPDMLGLTQAESHHIEIKQALRFLLRSLRARLRLTQAQAARKLKTSQSRFSKMENGDPKVSLDLLITSALGLGATFREIGEAIASWPGEPGVEEDAEVANANRSGTQPSAEPEAKNEAPTARSVRRTRSAKAA